MENKNRFIKKVLELAVVNVKKKNGGPFAAMIVKDNRIVSYGYNGVTVKCDPTLHAEIDAIRKASKKLKTFDLAGSEIYCSCQPCPMCLAAIYWANIKTVYYAGSKEIAEKYNFQDNKIYKELKTKIKSVHLIPVKTDNAEQVFIAWNNKKDKILY
jgi:guanine deaminase